MRYILIFILCLAVTTSKAQDDGYEPMQARVLALDTNLNIAKRFSEVIGGMVKGYNLAFVDNEKRYMVRYVFKNQKNETLRIDYNFVMESEGDGEADTKAAKKPVVTMQRISGELSAITVIYNFLFGANLSPERIMDVSTQGSRVKYNNNKECEFTLLADDYEPGYWVMSFHR
ncbi:MAG: hypothetical protein JST82_00045 [Bacteroidetes bacterium]|nr:hypothetical protein [Bacteroidota bacterium]